MKAHISEFLRLTSMGDGARIKLLLRIVMVNNILNSGDSMDFMNKFEAE
jgi:hypothetical protein